MDKNYTEEIRLSRELARAIEHLDEQYKNIIPMTIWKPYLKLKDHYQKEIHEGVQ